MVVVKEEVKVVEVIVEKDEVVKVEPEEEVENTFTID